MGTVASSVLYVFKFGLQVIMIAVNILVVLSLFCCTRLVHSVKEDLWREDLGRKINIGVSASGFDHIRLQCSDESMDVSIRTEEEFEGVIYIRGNFYSREDLCFLDANGGRQFHMEIPYDECKIQREDGIFRATLILQHDKELIMPGDGAFDLQCDNRYMDGNSIELISMSSISLADPDPSGKDVPTHLKSTVSQPNSVVFRPSDIRPKNSKTNMKKVEL